MNGIREYLFTAILCLAPISELRGAIPFALAKGASPIFVYPYCVILNALVAPLLYLFLGTVNSVLLKLTPYKVLFDRIVIRARNRVHGKVERFGYLGIALFVAVPLPITGAYTGTLGAWVLGLDRRKTYVAVLCGVAVAGVIVTLVSVFGIEALEIFRKNIGRE